MARDVTATRNPGIPSRDRSKERLQDIIIEVHDVAMPGDSDRGR